jgi:hypothetical protein
MVRPQMLVPGRLLQKDTSVRSAESQRLRQRLLPETPTRSCAEREGLRERLLSQTLSVVFGEACGAVVYLRPRDESVALVR